MTKNTVIEMQGMFLVLRAERFATMVASGHSKEALEWARKSIPEELMEEFAKIATKRLALKGLNIHNLWD